MVRKGDFELRLINAETKKRFKEHIHSDGNVYAEVEPKEEYYLRVRSHHPQRVVFEYEVDAKDLGYQSIFEDGNSMWDTQGLWNREEDNEHFSSLKFNELQRRLCDEDSDDESTTHHWTGSVKLKVYEYFPVGKDKYHEKPDFESPWYPDIENIAKRRDRSETQKSCHSIKGRAETETQIIYDRLRTYEVGDLIETVHLLYCSAGGLIDKGVLPHPKVQNQHASGTKRPRSDVSEAIQACRSVKVETFQRTSEFEVIDLT